MARGNQMQKSKLYFKGERKAIMSQSRLRSISSKWPHKNFFALTIAIDENFRTFLRRVHRD